MARPVVTVASGGMPVTEVTANALAVTEAAIGLAVTKVASGGAPVIYTPAIMAPPLVVSALASGVQITIKFNVAIDKNSVPPLTAFVVTKASVDTSPESISISGTSVVLQMPAGYVGAGATCRYTPGTPPLRGANKTNVKAFTVNVV